MPTLGQRVTLAVKAAIGVFSDNAAREAQGLLAGMYPGALGAPPTRGARERIAAYADMPWLHAVGSKVASAFASVEWTLSVPKRGGERARRMKAIQRAGFAERKRALAALKDTGDLTPITESPFLDLMNQGNSFMTGLAMRETTALHLDLEGEAFWLKERNALGVTVGAWPIPPDWVRATPTPQDRSFRVGFRGWQGRIPDTEVLWFQRPNPSNPYGRGTGMARALADELETDEYAARFIRATFFNQARPDFLIYPKNGATFSEPERRRLQHDWEAQHQGFWRAMKGRFASREVGVHEFEAHDFRHLQMIQLREFERNAIIQVWGVPLSFLGIITPGHSRATLAVEKYLFSRWVLVPRLETFRAMLQERLVPEYDEKLILDYISPVEDDRDFELEAARAFPSTLRVDEWRALQGRAPLDGDAGQGFLVPFNLTPMMDFSDGGGEATAPAALASLGALSGLRPDELRRLSTDELLAVRRLYGGESR